MRIERENQSLKGLDESEHILNNRISKTKRLNNCLTQDLSMDRGLMKIKPKKQKPVEASTLVESVKQEANLFKGW